MYLDDVIVDVLDSLSEPVSAGRLLQFVMIHQPKLPISWESYVNTLNTLVEQKKISEHGNVYSARTDAERWLSEIGL